METLEDVLRDDWLYPHPERLVTFIGNHDTARFLSQPGASVADLKLAFALLATLRGMPQIYSGDEIAMRGGGDPDNRHDFPGGFPGDEQNAFAATARTAEQAEVHDWVASLFQFRDRHPALANGEQQDVFVDPTAFVFVRTANLQKGCAAGGSEHYLVAVNSSDQPQRSEVPARPHRARRLQQFHRSHRVIGCPSRRRVGTHPLPNSEASGNPGSPLTRTSRYRPLDGSGERLASMSI